MTKKHRIFRPPFRGFGFGTIPFIKAPGTAGIRLAGFLFVLALAGCDGVSVGGGESYTFRFKVQNNTRETITQIEFLNGTNRDALVLRRIPNQTLGPNELSIQYRVPGFSQEYGINERYCAVILTYSDGTDAFRYGHFGPESKIEVISSNDDVQGKKIELTPGKW
jgi:hypothetical protein